MWLLIAVEQLGVLLQPLHYGRYFPCLAPTAMVTIIPAGATMTVRGTIHPKSC
ncbi:MAG: hypothetical protein H0V70_28455 [Ktedonobacteraceae bacterium]|nr:hypothetical protein [Ktedonobacteraceae bacterium]